MINKDWSRWITASVFEYLNTQLQADTTEETPVFPEGVVEMEPEGHQQWFELRLDGPFYRSEGAEWKVEIEVNILVSVAINEESTYRVRKFAAVASKALSGTINLFKYGSDAGDDESQFGCLQLGHVFENHFGKIGPATMFQQATIEARGITILTN